MDLHALTAAPFGCDDDVHQVLGAFADGSLPRSAWNHRAHLTVALMIARTHSQDVALDAMRRKILAYNAAAGIVSTVDAGYHETLTVFYMHIVRVHVARTPTPPSLAQDANLLVDEWGRSDLPLSYYSRERLFSREARAQWITPDLLAVPRA